MNICITIYVTSKKAHIIFPLGLRNHFQSIHRTSTALAPQVCTYSSTNQSHSILNICWLARHTRKWNTSWFTCLSTRICNANILRYPKKHPHWTYWRMTVTLGVFQISPNDYSKWVSQKVCSYESWGRVLRMIVRSKWVFRWNAHKEC